MKINTYYLTDFLINHNVNYEVMRSFPQEAIPSIKGKSLTNFDCHSSQYTVSLTDRTVIDRLFYLYQEWKYSFSCPGIIMELFSVVSMFSQSPYCHLISSSHHK